MLGSGKMKILDMSGRDWSHQHQMLRETWAMGRIINECRTHRCTEDNATRSTYTTWESGL